MDKTSQEELLEGGVPLRAIQQARDEQRLAAFIEALPLAVFVTDASGAPFYANRIEQVLLGKDVVPQATTETLAETLLNADGSVAFAIAVFRDITEERNLRERVLVSDRMVPAAWCFSPAARSPRLLARS